MLRVVVVEVHNTFGERHLYTLRPGAAGDTLHARPWRRTSTSRRSSTWRVATRSPSAKTASGLRIGINQQGADGPLLATSLVLRRRPLGDRTLARMLLRHPLISHKTIGMIHWHALRLWLRGARFHPHGQAGRAAAGQAAR